MCCILPAQDMLAQMKQVTALTRAMLCNLSSKEATSWGHEQLKESVVLTGAHDLPVNSCCVMATHSSKLPALLPTTHNPSL